jgi:anthranilate synthase component 1
MLEICPNSFEQFLSETEKGNVVPIVRSILSDLHTPIGALLRISQGSEQCFLFESAEGGERVARYSFLGANPYKVVRSRNSETIIEENGKTKTLPKTPLIKHLREHFNQYKLANRENLPPLCGGAIGYLSYDAVRWFEPILDEGKFIEHDDSVWMFFQTVLIFDRIRQKIEIVSIVFTDEAKGNEEKLRGLYEAAVAKTLLIENLLNDNSFSLPKNIEPPKINAFLSNWTRQDFIESVESIKERILNGDCFQVVLSQRFKRQISTESINVYRALRTTNLSPFMFYMNFGKETLIGASPERLLRCRGEKLTFRQFSGTRLRVANEDDDWAIGEDLHSDEKEIAEHTTLVDLGRNDLGKVAEFGSIEIDDLAVLEKSSHLQYLSTTLRAILKPELDKFDALAATFPTGSVSGVPKIKAMQIIKELEPTPRGVYAGAVGYIDYAENLDTCIAIRAIEIENNWASIQTGATITAESIPEREYEETINKARAMVKAIESAEKGI